MGSDSGRCTRSRSPFYNPNTFSHLPIPLPYFSIVFFTVVSFSPPNKSVFYEKKTNTVSDIYLFALSLQDHHFHIMDFLETVDTQILVGAAVALVAIVVAAFYIFSSNKPKGLTCFCLLLHYFFFFVDLIHCFTESSIFEFWVF